MAFSLALLGSLVVALTVSSESPDYQNMPEPPDNPFATATPTPYPPQGASGSGDDADTLSDEELAAIGKRLFSAHAQNDDAQQGASGQSGCPVKSSELSAVEFEDHSFTFGYGIFYGASDYRRLKSDYTVTVGGPSSVNVTIDYGPGHASQTRSANRRGPLYDDDGSYVWAAYHAYDTGFRTAPRPVSGRIASNKSVSITVSGCSDSGGSAVIGSHTADYSTPTPTPTPDPNPPARPTGLTASPGSTSMSLEWDDAPNADSYEVYQFTKDGDSGFLPYDDYTISFSESSAVVGNLTENKVYAYYVLSRKDNGLYSEWSDAVIATTTSSSDTPPPTATPVPDTPTPVPDTPVPTPVPDTPEPTPTNTPVPAPVSELQIHTKITKIDGVSTKGTDQEETTSDFLIYRNYWKVQETLQVSIEINGPDGVDVDDYEFRMTVPTAAGAYIGDKCDYSDLPSSTRTGYKDYGASFELVRCKRGDGASRIEIESRHKPTNAPVDSVPELLLIPQAPRHEDKTVIYRLFGPVPPVPPVPPGPPLQYTAAFVGGAKIWNDESAGVSVLATSTMPRNRVNLVTIEFDRDPCGDRRKPGCLEGPFASNLDTIAQWMDIKGPLSSGEYWTSSKDHVKDEDNIYYLQAVVAHEFGHAGGLGHSKLTDDLMHDFYSSDVLALSSDDIDAMRSLYR